MSSFTRTDTDPNVSSLGASHSLYSRQQSVGSGGIGTVYKGTQARLNRAVAIKEIKDIFHVFADVQREDIVERFIKIVQAQAALNHTNIIETLDIISDAEYPFVVTQWAPGGNLRRLIDGDGRPPLNVAMRYFLQILHALTAAHDAGLVHGGLKPENVVLDQAGNALLTDFGISRVVERTGGNQVYVGVGTVAYMSPEQFHSPNNISVKNDIYSLGIMFYEMLTGKVPGRRSPMPSSFYPDIPRKLDDIFDRMSMDSAEDRYDSINEILMEIYASPEVMKILDKRGGVLFLRDPMQHGASGLGKDVTFKDEPAVAAEPETFSYEPVATYAAAAPSEPSLADEDSEPDPQLVAQLSAHVSEVEVVAAPEAADVDAPAAPAAEDAPQGDVLDKLDKYGALFDDDDDDI